MSSSPRKPNTTRRGKVTQNKSSKPKQESDDDEPPLKRPRSASVLVPPSAKSMPRAHTPDLPPPNQGESTSSAQAQTQEHTIPSNIPKDESAKKTSQVSLPLYTHSRFSLYAGCFRIHEAVPNQTRRHI